jgi:thioesterase domain-containing protein
VPLGRPIPNVQIYLLDATGAPVAVGVRGEIYIGGAAVARGYLNQSEQTAARFIANPFTNDTTARLYRTGDLARYLPDGRVEFLGRVDHQVKVRGFRVELDEIELALRQHMGVGEVVVLAREDTLGDKRLVAYVVATSDVLTAADLRAFLKLRLPDYMLPAAFILLPTLPLTSNGKLDRLALPAPTHERDGDTSALIEPRDNIERHLVKIWEDLLKRSPLGVRDNFFEIGGHSLLAVQLIDQIEKTFNRCLPLDTLWFRGGTIEALASILREECQSRGNPELVPMKSGSRRPLFVLHTLGGNLFHYFDLLRHLNVEQAVYGLQARGVYGTDCPDHAVEAIATHCIEAMRTVQPDGPYLVAGYSSGGVVAFEVAQQLAAAGQRVALLALLDTYAPRAGPVWSWIDELAALRTGKRNPRQLQELAYFSVLHTLKLKPLRRFRTVGEAHRWAHWSYRPQAYLHPIEFFIVTDSENRAGTDSLGWARWTNGSLRIHRLPGHHRSMLKPPVVEELAARLQACIDRATDN